MLAPSVTRRLISTFARPEGGDPTAVERLTQREREVLAAIGEGLSNDQISRRLAMAQATTKTHVSRILAKLELRSRVQAAILAQDLVLALPRVPQLPR